MGGLATCDSYSERDTVLIVRKILEALVHMHGLGLVHCDVSIESGAGSVVFLNADELAPYICPLKVKPENICLAGR